MAIRVFRTAPVSEQQKASSRLTPTLLAASRGGASILGVNNDGSALFEAEAEPEWVGPAGLAELGLQAMPQASAALAPISSLLVQAEVSAGPGLQGLGGRAVGSAGPRQNWVIPTDGKVRPGLLRTLRDLAGVRSVEPNLGIRIPTDAVRDLPEGPGWAEWRWPHEQVRLGEDLRCVGVTVAVLDTGVYSGPPQAPVVPSLAPRWNWIDGTEGTEDSDGHGTACAATIGGLREQMAVAPGTSIVALKVLSDARPLVSAYPTLSYLIEAIVAAVSTDIAVLNVSIELLLTNDEPSPALHDALQTLAARKEFLLVAAAGNQRRNLDLNPVFPAADDSPRIVSVMATTANESPFVDGNEGEVSVDVAAPGVGILTPGAQGILNYRYGTSRAAPFVAGAISLAWARRRGLSASEVKAHILRNARVVGSLRGRCATAGILDLSFLRRPPFSPPA